MYYSALTFLLERLGIHKLDISFQQDGIYPSVEPSHRAVAGVADVADVAVAAADVVLGLLFAPKTGCERHVVVDAEGSITKQLLILGSHRRSSSQPLLPYHDSVQYLVFSSVFWHAVFGC